MIFRWPVWSTNCEDSILVSASLEGDRDAFAQIVRRYQALVASITYSATGNLSESEDLAQETFVAAWKHLKSLREPGKLRAWLCGIARHASANALRRQEHEPAKGAASLEAAINTPASAAIPVEEAITREQEAILWRSLEQIPETYREPLILFYRENQSVESVAQSLELSEEVVRQRLSRGRKLLEERVAAFVEGALRRSAPGPSFTLAVIGALPAQTAALGAAGVAAAKTGAATKAAWAVLLSAFAGMFAAAIATYLGFKSDMADAGSERERCGVERFYTVLAASVIFSISLILIAVLARSFAVTHPGLYSGFAIVCAFSWIPPTGLLLLWVMGVTTSARIANGTFGREPERAGYEYRSGISLLGLPLVHIRFGGDLTMRYTPVKAWIAMADIAVGRLLAIGGIAIAPLAVGGFVIGALSFGGIGAGILCYGGFAFGVWVMGGLVAGLKTYGGFALGWIAAAGGIAVARQFAQGGIMVARHAGDAAAQVYLRNSAFFHYAPVLISNYLLPILCLASLPTLLRWHAGRKKHRR